MNRYLKHILVILVFTLVGCKASAQKFTSHAVKKGETLQSISTQYKVTPQEILKYNKEIKAGQALTPNTILVIPAVTAQTKTPVIAPASTKNADVTDASIEQEPPIGFTSHKVRKRETLYGIAKRYKITEEDIKRYNRELYSSQLKKKMSLRIPKYRRMSPSDSLAMDPNNFEIYTVAPKETRWSIANKNGITIDSLLSLNPELTKTSDYLREGQELKLPKKPGSTIEGQVTQLYISYTVPPKMNFFQLKQQFGVEPEEIVRLNPEITERNGLKEGMVIRIPQTKLDAGEVNTDNYIFYEVKPKQTVYSLTRKLGLSYKELLALNPDLIDGLKAGMILKLPKAKAGSLEVRNSLVLDKISLLDSLHAENKPKLLFLLPFRLDKIDMADMEGVVSAIEKRNDVKLSLGLYSGALIALDSLADLGISVDVKTLDNQLDVSRTKALLAKENLKDYNAIVGPLDGPSFQQVAMSASNYHVPVIAPIRVPNDVNLANVFFTYPSDELLRDRMLAYMDTIRTNQHVIVIYDNKHLTEKKLILEKFPTADSLEIVQEEKSIGVNLEKLKQLLTLGKDNWVFLETDNSKLVSSVSSILNSSINKDVKVRMLTTNRNRAFENDVISVSHLSNLNFTYPSAYREIGNNSFVKRYQQRFGSTPDRYAVRGFDVVYDLLLKLAYKNDLFLISTMIGETEYNGNKFSYEKYPASGYFNQSSYIIAYDDMQIVELKK